MMGKHVAKFGKKCILDGVDCEYCSNPAKHQTKTRLFGVLGRLENTCNFHHALKQDTDGGGDNDSPIGSGTTGGMFSAEEANRGIYGAESYQPHHQSSEGA